MFTVLTNKYPNLRFTKHWELTKNSWNLLGQCEVYSRAISNSPIQPDFFIQLLSKSVTKSAHFSTQIEGNILSENEAEKVIKNNPKNYHENEVKNLAEATKLMMQEMGQKTEEKIITESRIKGLHILAGKELGEAFGAVPGEYRNFSKTNLKYRCADHEDIQPLVQKLGEWLLDEFRYKKGQEFSEIILEALTAHIYLLWIRPFADGNGPTSRLLENYILLRGGLPPVCCHILPQHYSLSRTEYFRQIENASVKRDLTEFFEYALQGLRNGFKHLFETIQFSSRQVIWKQSVYDFFVKNSVGHEKVAARLRRLAMSVDTDKSYRIDEIKSINSKIAREYANLSPLTLDRDLNKLVSLGIFIKENERFCANSIENLAKKHYL
jgi:Fic family protein